MSKEKLPRYNRGSLWPLLIITILVSVFFWPVLTGQHSFFAGDIIKINYAYQYFDYLALRSGELPLWNPYVYGGLPAWAESQGGPLYPPHLIFNAMLPFTYSFNLQIVFHYFWAGWGMFLWVKLLGKKRFGALVAAVAFSFSGVLITQLTHVNFFFALCWVPLLFYLTEKMFHPKNSWLVAGALTTALFCQFSVGHYQMQIYTWFFLLLYILFRFYSQKPVSRELGIRFLWTGITFLGLIAVFVLPSWELIGHSVRRGTVSSELLLRESFPPRFFLAYLVPYFLGSPANGSYLGKVNFWEICPYVGILTLALAALTTRKKDRMVIFLYGMLLVATLLSLGKHVYPLAKVLLALPVLGKMRAPARFIFFATFALCSLAGLGANQLITPDESKSRVPNRTIGIALLAVALVLGGLVFPLRSKHSGFMPVLSSGVWQDAGQKNSQAVKERSLRLLVENLQQQSRICFLSAFLFLGLSMHEKYQISPRLTQGLVLGIIAIDLFSFGKSYNPVIESDFLRKPPPLTSQLRQSLLTRSYSYQVYGYENYLRKRVDLHGEKLFRRLVDIFPPSLPVIWKQRFLNGYSSIQLDRADKYLRYLRDNGPVAALNLLTSANVSNLLSPVWLPELQKSLLTRQGDIYVYKLPPSGHAYLTTRVKETGEEILPKMKSASPASLDKVVFFEKSPFSDIAPSNKTGVVEITSSAYNKVNLRVNSATRAVLVLKDAFYPGWKAYVNGKETKIYRANYLFRAVIVPAGTSEVEFRYRPKTVLVGGVISFLCFVLVLAGVGKGLLAAKHK